MQWLDPRVHAGNMEAADEWLGGHLPLNYDWVFRLLDRSLKQHRSWDISPSKNKHRSKHKQRRETPSRPFIMQTTKAGTAATDQKLCSVSKDIQFSELEEYWFPSGPPEAIDAMRQETERLEWRINPDFLNPRSTCSFCQLISSCYPRGLMGYQTRTKSSRMTNFHLGRPYERTREIFISGRSFRAWISITVHSREDRGGAGGEFGI